MGIMRPLRWGAGILTAAYVSLILLNGPIDRPREYQKKPISEVAWSATPVQTTGIIKNLSLDTLNRGKSTAYSLSFTLEDGLHDTLLCEGNSVQRDFFNPKGANYPVKDSLESAYQALRKHTGPVTVYGQWGVSSEKGTPFFFGAYEISVDGKKYSLVKY